MSREPEGLSRAELKFRVLLRDGPRYALWARCVREQWERAQALLKAEKKP